MLIPVRIVLVDPSHPGNIGASARAMKTMGLYDLVLVRPKHFPSAEATARASGADDVLSEARVVGTLSEAIGDCGFVVGASARARSVDWPTVGPRVCARAVWAQLPQNRVAIVMGPEKSGLTNQDLGLCQQVVSIPTSPEYGSLNVAMALQILCYELRMAHPEPPQAPEGQERAGLGEAPLATAAELEGFHEHLDTLLTAAGFLHLDHPKQLRLKLRRIFHRAQLDQNEINILRGVLAALDPAKRPTRH